MNRYSDHGSLTNGVVQVEIGGQWYYLLDCENTEAFYLPPLAVIVIEFQFFSSPFNAYMYVSCGYLLLFSLIF